MEKIRRFCLFSPYSKLDYAIASSFVVFWKKNKKMQQQKYSRCQSSQQNLNSFQDVSEKNEVVNTEHLLNLVDTLNADWERNPPPEKPLLIAGDVSALCP